MVDVPIKLSGFWVALMLTYLLGDVLRLYSGDYVAGKMGNFNFTHGMWLGVAALMLIPIIMVLLSLTLPHTVNRWTNVSVAIFFFLFNVVGVFTYPSAYDKFLIIVGLVFNVLTVWTAWTWV